MRDQLPRRARHVHTMAPLAASVARAAHLARPPPGSFAIHTHVEAPLVVFLGLYGQPPRDTATTPEKTHTSYSAPRAIYNRHIITSTHKPHQGHKATHGTTLHTQPPHALIYPAALQRCLSLSPSSISPETSASAHIFLLHLLLLCCVRLLRRQPPPTKQQPPSSLLRVVSSRSCLLLPRCLRRRSATSQSPCASAFESASLCHAAMPPSRPLTMKSKASPTSSVKSSSSTSFGLMTP